MHGRDRGHQCGVKGSWLCGISYSWEVSVEEPMEQRRNQSPRDMRKGGGGGGWGSHTTAREKNQGAKHKASQIDLSLHQESRAKLLHYHTHHTLLDDRVPATYQVPAALHLHN